MRLTRKEVDATSLLNLYSILHFLLGLQTPLLVKSQQCTSALLNSFKGAEG